MTAMFTADVKQCEKMYDLTLHLTPAERKCTGSQNIWQQYSEHHHAHAGPHSLGYSCSRIRKTSYHISSFMKTSIRFLPHLGSDAGTSPSNANTGRRWPGAEVDEHVDWFPAQCLDKQSTNSERLGACVCAYGGHLKQLLWHCCMFHDLIERVMSMTFLTSSYCCKLLE